MASNAMSPLRFSSSSDSEDDALSLSKLLEDELNPNPVELKLRETIEAQLFRGPIYRRRKNHARDRQAGHDRLMADYFSPNPVYPSDMFRRRFRMRRPLFLHIMECVTVHDKYFQQTRDAIGKLSLSPHQKCTAAMRLLAYGGAGDSIDEYLRMGESTSYECLRKFCKAIIEVFGPEYLRRPNDVDLRRLLQLGEDRGFPGMLGSIDCMHWQWKNCPVAWKGQFTRGDKVGSTIMLEAVASKDLWIWHAFFGVAGSNNDINVINQSPLFTDVLQGRQPPIQFTINGRQYNQGYYLADGIYPEWAVFVKTISRPHIQQHKLFAKHQEGARKDVERAFGVLQARFHTLTRPTKFWDRDTLSDIMYACIILHNMIVEDKRGNYEGNFDFFTDEEGTSSTPAPSIYHGPLHNFEVVRKINRAIHSRETHKQLQQDLIQHIWKRFQEL